MPQPLDIASLAGPLEVLQQAMEAPNGLELEFDSKAAATAFKFRLYTARRANERENKKVYPAEHPMHGRSVYAGLSISQADGIIRIIKSENILSTIRRITPL